MKKLYRKYRVRELVRIRQIVTIHYLQNYKNYSTAKDQHDFWELVYTDTGHAEAVENDMVKSLSAGEITFHRPGAGHSIRIGEKSATVFIMSFVCTGAAMKQFRWRTFKLSTEEKGLISRLIREAWRAFVTEGSDVLLRELHPRENALPGAEQLICCYLEELLIGLLRRDGETEKPGELLIEETNDTRLAREIREYITEHLTERFTVEDVARHTQYSRAYISTRFRAAVGMGIMEYVARCRISAAKEYLREGELSVSQISDKLGFPDPHYFARRFRQVAGCTPTEYRNSMEVNLRNMAE